MPRRYPALTPREVIAILTARGVQIVRTVGSHQRFSAMVRDQLRSVTVDLHYDSLDDKLLKRMIDQSGLSREEFYGSTRVTARKINLRADEYPISLR
ncbi:MAG: type II toxin-antitoxin system HicA family toxin [Chloroflexi bacterium]|nr:type II toxin-antitoxin system HicA family toxin [Chloroflexota bacterium]